MRVIYFQQMEKQQSNDMQSFFGLFVKFTHFCCFFILLNQTIKIYNIFFMANNETSLVKRLVKSSSKAKRGGQLNLYPKNISLSSPKKNQLFEPFSPLLQVNGKTIRLQQSIVHHNPSDHEQKKLSFLTAKRNIQNFQRIRSRHLGQHLTRMKTADHYIFSKKQYVKPGNCHSQMFRQRKQRKKVRHASQDECMEISQQNERKSNENRIWVNSKQKSSEDTKIMRTIKYAEYKGVQVKFQRIPIKVAKNPIKNRRASAQLPHQWQFTPWKMETDSFQADFLFTK